MSALFYTSGALVLGAICYGDVMAQTEEPKPKKRKAPIAAVISAPKGETKKPSSTKVLSSIDDVEKEAPQEDAAKALINKPTQTPPKPKSEVLRAPKGTLAPVKTEMVNEPKKVTTPSSPILRTPDDAKDKTKKADDKSTEVIRTVEDAAGAETPSE
jgi:hypothetical protein